MTTVNKFDASQIDEATFKDWGISFYNVGASEKLDDQDLIIAPGVSISKPLTFGEMKNDFAVLQSLSARSGHHLKLAFGQGRQFILDDYKKNLLPGDGQELSDFAKAQETEKFTAPVTTVDRIYEISATSNDDTMYSLNSEWVYRSEYLYGQLACLFAVIEDREAQRESWLTLSAQAESAKSYVGAGQALNMAFKANTSEVDGNLVETFLTARETYRANIAKEINPSSSVEFAANFQDDEFDF